MALDITALDACAIASRVFDPKDADATWAMCGLDEEASTKAHPVARVLALGDTNLQGLMDSFEQVSSRSPKNRAHSHPKTPKPQNPYNLKNIK